MKPIKFMVRSTFQIPTIYMAAIVIKSGRVLVTIDDGSIPKNYRWQFTPDFISSGKYKFYRTPKEVQEKVMELCAIAMM